MKHAFVWARTGLVLSAFLAFATASHAAERLYSPYVEQGELEIEYFGARTVDGDDAKDDAQKQQFAVAYGAGEFWKTELYAKFSKDPGDNLEFDKWEWENLFQLTEKGEYWLDVGASIAYEWTPDTDEADTIEARLLLAKDVGMFSHVLNVIAEKDVASGPREGLESKLVWSSRYRYQKYFEPGIEVLSDFGEVEHAGGFDDQKHAMGPAAYGKVPLEFTPQPDALKYRAGYLVGVSDAAPSGDLFLQLEYELHF